MDSTDSMLLKWMLSIASVLIAAILGWTSKLLMSLRRTTMSHAQRITKVETKALAEREVREIIKGEVDPLKETLKSIQAGTKENQEILTELRVSNGVLMRLMHENRSTGG